MSKVDELDDGEEESDVNQEDGIEAAVSKYTLDDLFGCLYSFISNDYVSLLGLVGSTEYVSLLLAY